MIYHVYKKSVLTQSKLQSVHLLFLMVWLMILNILSDRFETDKYNHIVI